MPWMDGMRAVAVLAVIVFHELIGQPTLGIQRWATGGGLGVDVFFAISGFLITTLLLQEARDSGAIHFGAFYLRRARRLLPALYVILAVLVVASFADHGHQRVVLLERVAITFFYASNWVMALGGKTMQELNHTWSLAAEEQFYLLWPALLTGLLVVTRRWKPALFAGLVTIAAVALAWPQMAAARHWSFTRVYYGLDTRAAALAVGALLGALWVYDLLPKGPSWAAGRRVGAIIGVAFIALEFHNIGFVHHLSSIGVDRVHADYEVFALMGVATTFVLWELLESAPHVAHRILSLPPLVAIGRISYGLYLWDVVVVLALTPSWTGIHGLRLVALHLVAIFGLAITSWFVIERRFVARRTRTAAPALATAAA